MTLVLIGKGFVLGGLTFKNRGNWGSRYICIYTYIYICTYINLFVIVIIHVIYCIATGSVPEFSQKDRSQASLAVSKEGVQLKTKAYIDPAEGWINITDPTGSNQSL